MNFSIPVSERGDAVKYLLSFSMVLLLFCGCGKEKPEVDPAVEAAQNALVRCTKCRKENPLKSYQRVNQVLARCPACQKVIHIKEAQFGRKKAPRR